MANIAYRFLQEPGRLLINYDREVREWLRFLSIRYLNLTAQIEGESHES